MSLRPLATALQSWTPGRTGTVEPLHALAAAWPEIVGVDVAAHSAPLEISGTSLLIATRSSAWSQQLQLLSLAILERVRRVQSHVAIERLRFRVSALKRDGRRAEGAARPARPARQREPFPEPARDLNEAIARVRRRMAAARNAAARTCAACGAPLEEASVSRCAPCAESARRERDIEVQRLLYMAPWLSLEELRASVAGVTAAELERARTLLLQRWWLVLERARRAGHAGAGGVERQVASSYVLLQSRLAPDRVTAAIVRNVLGAELESILWPEHA